MEKEIKVFKEKKQREEGKMLEPAETVFIPMKEKVKKRRRRKIDNNE